MLNLPNAFVLKELTLSMVNVEHAIPILDTDMINLFKNAFGDVELTNF